MVYGIENNASAEFVNKHTPVTNSQLAICALVPNEMTAREKMRGTTRRNTAHFTFAAPTGACARMNVRNPTAPNNFMTLNDGLSTFRTCDPLRRSR
jgi:hypothetical protein